MHGLWGLMLIWIPCVFDSLSVLLLVYSWVRVWVGVCVLIFRYCFCQRNVVDDLALLCFALLCAAMHCLSSNQTKETLLAIMVTFLRVCDKWPNRFPSLCFIGHLSNTFKCAPSTHIHTHTHVYTHSRRDTNGHQLKLDYARYFKFFFSIDCMKFDSIFVIWTHSITIHLPKSEKKTNERKNWKKMS